MVIYLAPSHLNMLNRSSFDINIYVFIKYIMAKSLDFLLVAALCSFIGISLPITGIVINDNRNNNKYTHGLCNGTTLDNYKIYNYIGMFYRGNATVVATVNNTNVNSYLYYPPIAHWKLGFQLRSDIDTWYNGLSKNSSFDCYVDMSSQEELRPAIIYWSAILGYYIMFAVCLLILFGGIQYVCITRPSRTVKYSKLPPPYYINDPSDPDPPPKYGTLADDSSAMV